MKIVTSVFLVAVLAGCATGNPVQVEGIKVSSAQGVAACNYLDTVYGTSGWYGMFAEAGLENARLSAFDKTKKLGGTHVVWEPALAQTFGSTNVAARVYRCGA